MKRRLRNLYLGFWLTAAEKAQVASDARRRALSLSDYIRDRLGLSTTDILRGRRRRAK